MSDVRRLTSVGRLLAGGLLVVFGLLAGSLTAVADPSSARLDQLAAQAAKAGTIIWYESSPDDQAAKIVAGFEQRFPGLKLEHVRDTGGNSIGARIVQESQSGVRTGDLATTGSSIIEPMIARNLLRKIDWAADGLDANMAPSPYAVRTTAVVYVILYNSSLVSEAQAPKNWLDLLDPKWDGKIGIWVRGEGQGALAAAWGEDKVVDYVKKMNARHPVVLKSTFPLAQQVAAGEILVGFSLYHSAQPPIRRGAPVKVVVPEPVPVETLYSVVPEKAGNPAGGELVALWLATPEGGKVYEDATDRGNPLLPNTKTHALLAGHTMAEYPAADAGKEAVIVERLNKLIESGATE
ncbi:MAG TPA: ABC transporter substrate-binding protein [Alphaproteobacteria bacterium]|nr:ABC transporter substrate-binding protein [Alphaproteobacteria bacterium]